MDRLTVGVFFGSRSVEHDVSIITARQVMAALDPTKYRVAPVYLTETGRWLVGDALADAPLADFKAKAATLPGVTEAVLAPTPGWRDLLPREPAKSGLFGLGARPKTLPVIDVAFPCVHGTMGEDGTLQGLFELADIPYVGAGVVGSAVGMDKILARAAFAAAGIPQTSYQWFTKADWNRAPDRVLDAMEAQLGFPVYVKPANLGSSVGINRANDRDELEYAIEVAIRYDRRILVEHGLDDIVEINCSVLGNDDPVASVCEQPVRWQEILTFEDKYLAGGKQQGMGGQRRVIPAPIDETLTARAQELAVAAFRAIDCAGIARVDLMLRPSDGAVWVNEVNTIPGSLAFYLWEASGVSFRALCDQLIALANERAAERRERLTTFSTALLTQAGSATGTKQRQ